MSRTRPAGAVEETDDPEGCADDAYACIHLYAIACAVPYPEGALVIRCCIVIAVYLLTVFLFKGFTLFQGVYSVECEDDVSDFITLAKHCLEGGERTESLHCLLAFVFFVDTYNLEGEVVDFYVFTEKSLV